MGKQRERVSRADSGSFEVVMELLLRLAGVTSSMSVFLSLSSLHLAGSLAGGLLFSLEAIMTKTTEKTETIETIKTTETTETTKTTKTTKTTDTQTIRRQEEDNVGCTITMYNDDTCEQDCGR